jgi:hypothetical protein
MALFILIIVAIVIAQTWLDWRDAERRIPQPAWASGCALAGVLAASLTATTSLASIFYRRAVSDWTSGLASGLILPQIGFLLCALGIVIAAVRKKRLRTLLLLAGLLSAAFWLGLALAT